MPRYNVNREPTGRLGKLAALQQLQQQDSGPQDDVMKQLSDVFSLSSQVQNQQLQRDDLGLRREQFESERELQPLKTQNLQDELNLRREKFAAEQALQPLRVREAEANVAALQHANNWLQANSELDYNTRFEANRRGQQTYNQQEQTFPLTLESLRLANAAQTTDNQYRVPFAEQRLQLGAGELALQPGRLEEQRLGNQGRELQNTAQGQQNDWYPTLQQLMLDRGTAELEGQGINNQAGQLRLDALPAQLQGDQQGQDLQNVGLGLQNTGHGLRNTGLGLANEAQSLQNSWLPIQLNQQNDINDARLDDALQPRDLPNILPYLPKDVQEDLINERFPDRKQRLADEVTQAELKRQAGAKAVQDLMNSARRPAGQPHTWNALKSLFLAPSRHIDF